jgi:hypothetical protein
MSLALSPAPLPIFANKAGDDIATIGQGQVCLFIDQQMEFGSIADRDAEKEYLDVYDEVDASVIRYKSTSYNVGTEVQLLVKAEEGYKVTDIFLEKIEADEHGSHAVEYAYDEKTSILTFTMPDINVCASASFGIKEDLNTNSTTKSHDSSVSTEQPTNEQRAEYEHSYDTIGEQNVADVYIHEFNTQLFYGATNTDDGYIWNANTYDSGHRFSFRINYAISGVDVAPVNSVRFTIPKSILVDREGNRGDDYEMSIPSKMEIDAFLNGTGESIDTDVNFGYFEDGNNILIYNFRELEAGNNGYIEMSYFTTKTTFNYIDMMESQSFVCRMTVPQETKETAAVVVRINTTANVSSMEKRYPTKYTNWQSAWGTEIKPENDTDYHYLVWTIESYINATQPYDFTLEDTVVGNFEGMAVLGYKFSGQSAFGADNIITNQTQTKTRYDYVITSIPLAHYKDKTYWEANNTISVTVKPVDRLDENTQYTASRQWTWTKPAFDAPSGYVNVYKRADGAYRAYNGNCFANTYHSAPSLDFAASEYTRYDMETFNGYNNNAITNSEFHGFKYASWIVGSPYPWTYDSSHGDPLNHEAYGKLAVKYELIDEGVYLTNETENTDEFSDLLTSEDFKFVSLGYSWYMTDAIFDEETQTFKETTVSYTENDIITFYGKFDTSDEWMWFASYNICTKELIFDDSYVQSMTNNDILFRADVDLVAYKVTTENAHYYTELFTVPHLTLKNSQTVIDYVTGKPAIGIHNSNFGNFYQKTEVKTEVPTRDTTITPVQIGDATVMISKQDAEGRQLPGAILQILDVDDANIVYAEWTSDEEIYSVSLDADKSYILREVFVPDGYAIAEDVTFSATDGELITMTNEVVAPVYEYSAFANLTSEDTEYARISQRYSNLDKSVVSVSNNVKKRTYTISWKIFQSETMEWGSGGSREYLPQNGGIFYDLLPDGAVFDKKSVDVSTDNGKFLPSSAYNVITIDNYRGTGRTMVIVDIDITGNCYQVYYNTVHSWNSLADYGKNVYNPVAYETGNESITNGSPDNGGSISDASLMSSLNDDSDDDSTGAKFLYAEKTWDIVAITAASSGLMKKVKSEDANVYTYETTTTINDTYSYQLRFMNSYTSASKNMIFFDSLENYDYDTMLDLGKLSDWRGELQGIDVNQLKTAGIAPVIYYSTISNLNIEENYDISDTSIWAEMTDETDLSIIKALAIDMRKDTNGNDFVLDPGRSVTVTLYMKAPAVCPETEDDYAYTYNNVYMYNTVFDPTAEDSMQDFLIHQDYTTVKLLVTGSFGVDKVSAESEEIKIEGLEFRLIGTSAYGTVVDKIVKTDTNGQIYFDNIEMGSYILQEYKSTDDWLLDTTEYDIVIDNTGKVWIDNVEYTDSCITIKNKPRIHGDFGFYKKELGDNSFGISGTKFRLSGTSDYGNDILMYSSSASGGKTVFANIELGTYQLEEVASNPNYFLNNLIYTVRVDETGAISIVGSNEKDAEGNTVLIQNSEWIEIAENGNIYIYNEYKYSEVEIRKVDAENPTVFLEGAIFSLTGVSNSGAKVELTASSDRNGFIAFNDVEQGVYVLKELQAPKNLDEAGKSGGTLNYRLDETEYVVKVGDRGVVAIEGLVQEEGTGYFIITNARAYDKEIVITKIWDDGLTSGERIAKGIIPKLHLTNRDLSQDANFHTHNWDGGVVLSVSTCSKHGETMYTCTDCNMTNIEKADVPEHVWGEGIITSATCKEEGYTLYACMNCGTTKTETIEILPHTWDDGVTSVEASCTAAGEMLYTCIECGTTKTEPISMLPHDYSAEDGTCIVCGELPYLYTNVIMNNVGTATVSVSTSDYDYYNSSMRPYYSKIITFAPTESGTYTFTASSSIDSYGRLYDADMNSLAQNDDGVGNQFKITYTCTAGTVYYLAVGFYYNQSTAQDIPVAITKIS